MKKTLTLLLILILLLVTVSCGTEAGEEMKAPSTLTEEAEGENKNEGVKNATISETVLLDQSGVKIVAKELSADGILGPKIKLLIENNGSEDVTVQTNYCTVNGYMIDPILSETVAAGKKANSDITFMEADLEDCHIDVIAEVEISFSLLNSATYETILDSEAAVLKTSAADGYEPVYDHGGKTIYDENGIKVVAVGISEESGQLFSELMLYLYNGSEKNIVVQMEDVSVNGFMVTPAFSQDIISKKHAVSDVSFLKSELEENGIESIEKMEFSLQIFDSESYATIVETDPISLNF